jgi:hypothetical protein
MQKKYARSGAFRSRAGTILSMAFLFRATAGRKKATLFAAKRSIFAAKIQQYSLEWCIFAAKGNHFAEECTLFAAKIQQYIPKCTLFAAKKQQKRTPAVLFFATCAVSAPPGRFDSSRFRVPGAVCSVRQTFLPPKRCRILRCVADFGRADDGGRGGGVVD